MILDFALLNILAQDIPVKFYGCINSTTFRINDLQYEVEKDPLDRLGIFRKELDASLFTLPAISCKLSYEIESTGVYIVVKSEITKEKELTISVTSGQTYTPYKKPTIAYTKSLWDCFEERIV